MRRLKRNTLAKKFFMGVLWEDPARLPPTPASSRRTGLLPVWGLTDTLGETVANEEHADGHTRSSNRAKGCVRAVND